METSTSGFGQTPSSKQLSLVNKIVHEELVEIYSLLPALEPSNCLLSDFGDYLCRTTDTIAQLAHRIVHGNHIPEYARLNVAEMAERMDLSELGFLDHLTAKHSILKDLVEKLENASKDMSQAWSDCTAGLPKESSGETTWTTVGDPETAPLTANMSPFISPLPVDTTLNASNHQSVQAAMEAADDTSIIALPESPNSMVENLLREKNSRGKGRHYCPYRLECTKGGVSADKSLVLFERNSAFKAHLQKHRKHYKCDLPGCTNKSGFSCLDLLHRHQNDVLHKELDGTP